jgi:glutamate-1-semialdehyde aminotransferase
MKLDRSRELLERAFKVIPSGTQTFSKGPNQWARGVSPAFLQRGEGAWVWDVDGNRFLDYLMALGPIVLGYRNAAVDAALVRQIAEGPVFSQMHPLEVEVAELIVDLVPCAQMVRFGKNGSDVTTAAVRAARAVTGREHIAYCGYHGWHDWYIGTTTRDLGVPAAVKALTHSFAYNDIDSLQRLYREFPGRIAAVVMEPVGVEPPRPGFLQAVRETVSREGSLLVFDEIVTGFRFAMGGAQEYFGVTPDLACFGKAMANGMPLSAIAGKREIMEVFDRIFFSGTFGGEALSLAACRATIDELRARGAIQHIWSFGQELMNGINALLVQHDLQDTVRCLGYAPRSVLAFPHADEHEARVRRTYFMQECVKRGLLYFCSHIPTLSHGEAELRFTLEVMAEVVGRFAVALRQGDLEAKLEGPVVEAIFRRA